MTIYWLLFAFPAIMALAYPVNAGRNVNSATHVFAFACFIVIYSLLALVRYEVGGDWGAYELMYDSVRQDTFEFAVTKTDPVFGTILWLSAQADLGIYLANGICAALLGWGIMRTALMTREPWLGLTIAVPYILIVVGMGYMRQAAATGLILMAISTIERAKIGRTILYLVLAAGFHSTAAIVYPLFGYVMTQRHKVIALVLSLVGGVLLLIVITPRLAVFELGYLEQGYDSQGTLIRLLMSALPSALLLARYKYFIATPRVRVIWIGIAMANLGALAALAVSPSTTAVDRMALYFSPIQVLVFGEIRSLAGISDRTAFMVRIFAIGVAAGVQAVFLVFAAHAEYWVPYQWVFSQL